MTPFLIIQSDSGGGRGVRGRSLYWFLTAYFGRRRVKMISSNQLLRSDGITADTVFVGCPSNIGAVHLANLRYRRLVLFDLADRGTLRFENSDEPLLRSLTNQYLKTWVDRRRDYGMDVGVAPVRRYAKLTMLLNADRWRGRSSRLRRIERVHDVAFLGSSTRPMRTKRDESVPYFQRVDWLLEVAQAEPSLALWGGLLMKEKHRDAISKLYGDVSGICCERKINFLRYFRALQQSKVALCASGQAPWTYRHYEAIYAGATVVTTDMRSIDTLIPLPKHGVMHVADYEPVVPAIERAIKLREEQPQIIDENVAFLEQFLCNGDYSRRRPELLDRFMSQLPATGAEGVVADPAALPAHFAPVFDEPEQRRQQNQIADKPAKHRKANHRAEIDRRRELAQTE